VVLVGTFHSAPDTPGALPSTAADAAALVSQSWAPETGRVASIDVVATHFYAGLPHARHLRSDLGVGITMEPGFSRFASPAITDASGVEWAYRHRAEFITKWITAEAQIERAKGSMRQRIHG
jgi:hypothetical protein